MAFCTYWPQLQLHRNNKVFHRHKQSSVLPSICKDFKTIDVREDLELEKAEELLKKSEEATEEFFAAPEEEDDDEDDEDYVPMEVDASAPDKSQAGIFVDTNLILLFDLPFYGLMCLGCTLGLFVSRRNILLHRLAQSLKLLCSSQIEIERYCVRDHTWS